MSAPPSGKLPGIVLELHERRFHAFLVSFGAAGAIIVILAAAYPWYQIGGSIFDPSPRCALPGGPFTWLAGVLAVVACLFVAVRAFRTAAGLGSSSAGVVLVAVLFGFQCLDCGCSGGSQPAFGWLLALTGSAMTLSSAILGMLDFPGGSA